MGGESQSICFYRLAWIGTEGVGRDGDVLAGITILCSAM
jgi:hypothetical protein